MAGKKKKCNNCGGGNKGRGSSYQSTQAKLKILKVGEEIKTKEGRTFKIIDVPKK